MNKLESVVPSVLQAFDEEHDVKKFQPMHERQRMERIEPGAQEIIADDKFRGSRVDIAACNPTRKVQFEFIRGVQSNSMPLEVDVFML